MNKNKTCQRLIVIFLIINFFFATSVGWGGEQGFELGWIFLLPLIFLTNLIFFVVSIIILFRNNGEQIIEIVETSFIFLLIEIAFVFYTRADHNIFNFYSFLYASSLIILLLVVISILVSIIKIYKDKLLLKRLFIIVFKSILIIGIFILITSIYTKYRELKYEEYQKCSEQKRELLFSKNIQQYMNTNCDNIMFHDYY